MIRKEPERGGGRRPLLAAFVGNNRQMLNDIRDSLSHLRKSQLEGDGDGSMQLRTELSQSTPNLADKSNAPTGTKKGLENHHKTLAEIREALRPFQTGRDRTQGSSGGDVTRHKIQQVTAHLGVDEVRYFVIYFSCCVCYCCSCSCFCSPCPSLKKYTM